MAAFENSVESTISRWHGITAPNEPAKRLAAELAATIEAFAALRGQIAFEDEPSSFESALEAAKETMPVPAATGAGR
jgi:hypothetical protein